MEKKLSPEVESSTWPLNSHNSSENYPKTNQKTPSLMHVIKGDYLRDTNCPIPPVHCKPVVLSCNGACELGKIDTEWFWFMEYTVPMV